MVTKKQALDVLNKIRESKPTQVFQKVDETSAGMNYILIYLKEHSDDVYASTVADEMRISRARVAVLLQKLISKGLIEKQVSNSDARIDVIKLTEKGVLEVDRFKEKMVLNVIKVIEGVGLEQIYNFIETSKKIKDVLKTLE